MQVRDAVRAAGVPLLVWGKTVYNADGTARTLGSTTGGPAEPAPFEEGVAGKLLGTDTRRWRKGEPHAVNDATYLNILTSSERSGPLPDQSQDERLRPNNQPDGRQRPPQLETHRQVPQ